MSDETPAITAEQARWLCSGCGAPSLERERVCDCVTDCLYRLDGATIKRSVKYSINAELEKLRATAAALGYTLTKDPS